jgi:hypothetical protein
MKLPLFISYPGVAFSFLLFGFVAVKTQKFNPTHTGTTLPKDSLLRTSLFVAEDVERIKEFFTHNASLPEQPRGTNWQPGYRHKCINTVRAGLDILLFGNSSIPDSLYSRNTLLNGNFENNDIYDLVRRLKDSNYISSYDSVRFVSMRKGQWTAISKSDPVSRGLPPVMMEKSLWNTLLARVGKERGYSVFLVSLCDGYHAALLTLDHRNTSQLKVYWADQTHKHPLRFFVNNKLTEVPDQYGWEVMQSNGPDTVKIGMVRGLDAYALYANKKYWCDCGRENPKQKDCCAGNCFPFIQIWRLQKSRNGLAGI